jgi:alanine racemase
MLDFSALKEVTQGKVITYHSEMPVEHLLLDSRKIINPHSSIFFAIKGPRHDGHQFLSELHSKGIRQFIVESEKLPDLPESNIIKVDNSVKALQAIAAWHRERFKIPVIGITGSNGKTIIKEWLTQLLAKDLNIVRSPKSFNSQVGVPLSVWQITGQHSLGIFEAGISKPGEMENLFSVIRPTIGIFTNIGPAHDEGFSGRKEKVKEKLKLFKESKIIFYHRAYEDIEKEIASELPGVKTFSISHDKEADLFVKEIEKNTGKARVQILFRNKAFTFHFPFSDEAAIENLLMCVAILLNFGVEPAEIQTRVNALQKVAMRLEIKEGINGCFIIDDTYNNDLAGLTIAVNFLDQQKRKDKKTIIVSDLLESGMEEQKLYSEIASLFQLKGIEKIIGIGENISRNKNLFGKGSKFYPETESFLKAFDALKFQDEIILVKGARKFQFEKIVARLQQKVHGTVLEVNLDALSSNLNFYKSKLKPQTKMMAMVKAFAYGSGSYEIANLLQFHRVDYLSVAYADEGVALRENGISLPVMVMNPAEESFDKMFQYNLEPEIYSFRILKQYTDFLNAHEISSKIHIKLDTGMRRLGFEEKDVKELGSQIKANRYLKVASIFTHLAGADEDAHNEFTFQQLEKFSRAAASLEEKIGYKTIKHALNSAGILRFPEHQFEMVRLGIGIYGVECTGRDQEFLQPVGTLKTIISQIKNVKAGETVGYSRKGKVDRDSTIATIAIGYADGYDRRFSNGVGVVMIKGKLCPVIGNVCMDMTMVDITGVDAEEGDEVIVFGREISISKLASDIGTIPYEILTNVSERVKRVFYTE